MKIISYNINGINSFVNNKKLDELLISHPADIYCFQELKTNDITLLELLAAMYSDFDWYWSVDKSKAGYSGVATLVRKDISNKHMTKFISYSESLYYKSETPEYNTVIAGEEALPNVEIYSQGRVLVLEFENFILFNVYVPNSNKKDDMRKEFDKDLLEDIKHQEKPVIICGDFNVCNTSLDYWGNWEKEVSRSVNAGLKDYEVDNFNKLLTEGGLIDIYRKMNEGIQKYSYFTQRSKDDVISLHKGWRLDYFLVSQSITENVTDTDIYEGFQGKDHSPVSVEVTI